MSADPQTRNHRYLILPADSSSLYRTLARLQGINTGRLAEQNIHVWLDPLSPSYQPLLHKAVLSYVPRTTESERFRVCVASEEMEAATWQYGQNSQIILDGTFGVCDSRLLLFIVMGVDEDGHGVPLVFFLFSAPTGNRQTAAGYDTDILTTMLQDWKTWLERKGERFTPKVAITDTDTKERGALVRVFKGIILLLCKFHLRQCWTNKRRSLLNSIAASDFSKQQTRTALQALEIALVGFYRTTGHSAHRSSLIASLRQRSTTLLWAW